MSTCNLIITRKIQLVASLVSCNIIIDGIDYGVIKNGSHMQCSLNDGNHEITLKWWRTRKNSVFSFYIPVNLYNVHINVNFSKLKETFILSSNDIKIENCSCNTNKENYINSNNPSHSNMQELHESNEKNVISGDFDNLDGIEFENWCANLLRNNGFANVEITKASGDQGVDILAEKNEIKYAIQCKCYSNDLGNSPVQEVHAGKSMYNCHIGAVMTNRHFTKGAKDLAKATGVLLWDREKLLQMMSNDDKNEIYSILNHKSDVDPLLFDAIRLALANGKISTSLLQRKLMVGYGRSAELIDKMEDLGIVGPANGNIQRKILISECDAMKIFNKTI